MAELSKDEWIERLRGPLQRSMRRTSDRMTNHPAVQEWLRNASLEAAVEVGNLSDTEASARAYSFMREQLAEKFPSLLDAIHKLTHGHGTVDINWRPLAPQFSSLFLTFPPHDSIDISVPLETVNPDAISAATDRMIEALPKGLPFPKHPHTVDAMLTSSRIAVHARVEDRNEGGQRRVRNFMLPENGRKKAERLPRETFENRLFNAIEEG